MNKDIDGAFSLLSSDQIKTEPDDGLVKIEPCETLDSDSCQSNSENGISCIEVKHEPEQAASASTDGHHCETHHATSCLCEDEFIKTEPADLEWRQVSRAVVIKSELSYLFSLKKLAPSP